MLSRALFFSHFFLSQSCNVYAFVHGESLCQLRSPCFSSWLGCSLCLFTCLRPKGHTRMLFQKISLGFPSCPTTYSAKSGSVKVQLWCREDERSLLWSPNNADQLITQDSMLWASRRSLNLIAHKTLSLIWAQETVFRPLAVDTNVWTNSHIFIFIIIFVGSLKNAYFYKQQ